MCHADRYIIIPDDEQYNWKGYAFIRFPVEMEENENGPTHYGRPRYTYKIGVLSLNHDVDAGDVSSVMTFLDGSGSFDLGESEFYSSPWDDGSYFKVTGTYDGQEYEIASSRKSVWLGGSRLPHVKYNEDVTSGYILEDGDYSSQRKFVAGSLTETGVMDNLRLNK